VTSKPDLLAYLGKSVRVLVDRPMGSVHPRDPDIYYPVNYGYVPCTISGDGSPIDAYLLGSTEPVLQADGVVIAVVIRDDDNEDKLVVTVDEHATSSLDERDIMQAVAFQEQYFQSQVVMKREA
jgi:inorganic pyrophosphatase